MTSLAMVFAVASIVAGTISTARAQEPATSTGETAKASEQVLLDEPTPAPEPTVAQEGPVSDKYADGKVRVERNIRLLSDNQVVNHGKFTEYYQNGQKFSEGNFDSGVHDGPWSYWHDNGQLAKTVTFKKGAPDGVWEVFRADGTLQERQTRRRLVRLL